MIDALSIARDLAVAGIEKPHAEAQAKAIANAVDQAHGDLATKDFVRSEIQAVRSDMKALEVRLIIWGIGTGIALAALSVTVLGLWIG